MARKLQERLSRDAAGADPSFVALAINLNEEALDENIETGFSVCNARLDFLCDFRRKRRRVSNQVDPIVRAICAWWRK
jgi:hypothetical protein